MAWYYMNSVGIANGGTVVSVTGGVDLSQIKAGWMFSVGSMIAEVKSGTAPDGSGNSTIILERAWEGVTATAQTGLIAPTSGALVAALEGLKETNDYAIEVHKKLSDIATLDADVTIKDSAGTDHTFASMPKNARLVAESIAQEEQEFSSFKANIMKLIPYQNLLPDPSFLNSAIGFGVPSGFTLSSYYGAVLTVEVAELTEGDKVELATVLNNANAFVDKNSSAFYMSEVPRKIVINQTVAGSSSSAVRFSCDVNNVLVSPIYMSLLELGGITKKTGDSWVNGVSGGMYFSKGDIDDGKVFQLVMNGVTTWEIFMPFLIMKSDEKIYANT